MPRSPIKVRLLRAADWNCDNLFVAAHWRGHRDDQLRRRGGIDVATVTEDALKRIEALADIKACISR